MSTIHKLKTKYTYECLSQTISLSDFTYQVLFLSFFSSTFEEFPLISFSKFKSHTWFCPVIIFAPSPSTPTLLLFNFLHYLHLPLFQNLCSTIIFFKIIQNILWFIHSHKRANSWKDKLCIFYSTFSVQTFSPPFGNPTPIHITLLKLL